MAPQLIFGTASFGMAYGAFTTVDAVAPLLDELAAAHVVRLDTAPRYPPTQPGRSEALLGEAGAAAVQARFALDSKVFTDVSTDGAGDLSAAAVDRSVRASLERLRVPALAVLHIHRADPATPLEEQVRAFDAQIAQGRCKAWGVSNVPPERLAEMLATCEALGVRKPVCYQGDYNLMTRGMEKKLLPLLRAHGMTFNAFRPLGGGFLTGKAVTNATEGTRFASELGHVMHKVFGAEDLHEAVRRFDGDVRAHGLEPAEVAVRWITHHSALGEADGIVLGASRTEQFIQTSAWIGKGSLPAEVLEAAERVWTAVEGSRADVI